MALHLPGTVICGKTDAAILRNIFADFIKTEEDGGMSVATEICVHKGKRLQTFKALLEKR